MGLTDSLKTELIAMGKDATFTEKLAAGKITWGDALKDTSINIDLIGDALLKSNNVSKDAKKALEAVTESTNKTSDAYRRVVNSIIDGSAGFGNLNDSIIDISTMTPKTTGVLSSVKQTFTGLAASLKPLLPLMATAATLFAAYEGFKFLDDKYTLTFKTAQDHLAESSSAYANTMSELGELNSKTEEYKSTLESIGSKYDISFSGTETIEEMITKIRSLDGNKLEITDEATINKLERENTLLDTQQKILTTTATTQQKKAAEDARKSINFSSEDILI